MNNLNNDDSHILTSNNTRNTQVVAGNVTDSNVGESVYTQQIQQERVINYIEPDDTITVGKEMAFAKSSLQAADERAHISEFLQRPIHIGNFNWGVGSGFLTAISPWSEFMTNTVVAKKIENYSLIKFNLSMRIMINGTPFHYGRLMASYNPYSYYERNAQFTTISISDQMALINQSQRPHVFIDPATNQTVEIELPFFNVNNWIKATPFDITETNNLGTVTIKSLNDLAIANANASNSVEIQVFLRATNVELAIPTAQVNSGVGGEVNTKAIADSNIVSATTNGGTKDEYEKDGVISSVATAVSNAASALVKVPVIAPFARATEIGAGAVSSIAKIFGFSKPVVVTDINYVRNTILGNMATTSGSDGVFKLTFDPKQETSISNAVANLKDGTDEMAISFIAGVESYLTVIPWSQSAVYGDVLYWFNVTPNYASTEQGTGIYSGISLTSIAYAALPFKYWSGTIIFRFQVVATQYHTGRYRISYEPGVSGVDTTNYNSAYSAVMNLQDSNDFEVAVSWAQAEAYNTLNDVTIANYGTGGLDIGDGSMNGRLFVTVVNPLKAPLDTADIAINVFVRAGPDFEVFAPKSYGDGFGIGNLHMAEVNSGECHNKTDGFDNTIQLVGNSNVDILQEKALTFSGEKIDSFRAYMKRYACVDYINHWNATISSEYWQTIHAVRHLFPRVGGPAISGYVLNGAKDFNVARTSLMPYLRYGYVGWRGGIRYKIVAMSNQQTPKFMTISRCNNQPVDASTAWVYQDKLDATELADPFTVAREVVWNKDLAQSELAWIGAMSTAPEIMPSLEVEFPYYNNHRFCVAVASQLPQGIAYDGSNEMFYQINIQSKPQTSNINIFQVFAAPAEDFNYLWYIGAPMFVYQT